MCDHSCKWHGLWMKKKINKIQFHLLTYYMYIINCDYHVIILVSNKNE